jgi:hypothetical protein
MRRVLLLWVVVLALYLVSLQLLRLGLPWAFPAVAFLLLLFLTGLLPLLWLRGVWRALRSR